MNFLRRRRNIGDEDENDIIDEIPSYKKSRRPPNTAFRQQRLKAWQPILTPRSVIPLLIVLTVIFAPLGIAILHTIYNVEVMTVDYSTCENVKAQDFESVPSKHTSYHFRNKNSDPKFQWKVQTNKDSFGDEIKTCVIQFDLPVNIKPPIYLYYKLTNFYQNHRKYVESYDLGQLKGKALSSDDVTDNCRPLKHIGSGDDQRLIYPCGLIANSCFNDTISSPVLLNAQGNQNNETFVFSSDGISWPSDRRHKFKKTTYDPKEVVPPPNWYKLFPHGYTKENMPDVSKMEHLQNWMRTAGLPSFYKLYGKNTTDTLQSGTYQIEVTMNYPVSIYGGTKTIVITNNSIFGGRNMSLGVIYIMVAVVCLVLAIAFLLQHLIKPRKVGDHNYLHGNNPESATSFREQL